MKTYRVAILGCRSRGTSAARAYHAHPRTKVVGLCDLIEDRLNTLGDELDLDARFTDLDEMIRQTGPDIVAIAFHHLERVITQAPSCISNAPCHTAFPYAPFPHPL